MDVPNTLQQMLDRAREASARGDAHAAVHAASAAADRARELGDDARHAEAQSLLLLHLFSLGRFAQALRHGHLALQGWQRLDAPERVCETQLRLALSLSELGIHARALTLAREAFDTAQRQGLHGHGHQAVAMLGGLFGRAGSADEGEMLLLQALSRASEAGDPVTATAVLNTLLALLLGALEQARQQGDEPRQQSLQQRLRRHVGRALAHGSDEPHPFRRVVLRGNAGAALAACGLHEDGLVLLRSAATEAAQAGFRVAEMRQRVRLAQVQLALEDPTAALTELERLQVLLAEEPLAAAQLEGLECRAQALAAQGRLDAAAALAGQARAQREAQAAEQARLREQVERDAADVLAELAPGA